MPTLGTSGTHSHAPEASASGQCGGQAWGGEQQQIKAGRRRSSLQTSGLVSHP